MRRVHSALLAIVVGSCAPGVVLGQPPVGPAAGERSSTPQRRPAPRTDLAVVFWCSVDDPVGTLRHQVYDVRKGEYTPAVDRWMEAIWRDYPGYVAFRRDVDLRGREPRVVVEELVRSETRRLTTALLTVASAMAESAGGLATPATGPRRGAPGFVGPTAAGRTSPALPRPALPLGLPRPFGPDAYPFPTPFPYPKPHP